MEGDENEDDVSEGDWRENVRREDGSGRYLETKET